MNIGLFKCEIRLYNFNLLQRNVILMDTKYAVIEMYNFFPLLQILIVAVIQFA